MILNYLKIAWRNLIRNRGYSLLNIAGLAVALAVFMVIIQFIRHETSYDRHLPESEQIYRILMHSEEHGYTRAGTPMGLPRHMADLYPEITHAAKARPPGSSKTLFEYRDRQLYEEGLMAASQDFFHIFQYEFIHGSREGSLMELNSMVLTESLAEEIFGEANPVGETVTVRKHTSYTVTGVVEDPPSNTYLGFSAVVHYPEQEMGSWSFHTLHTYLRLTDIDATSLQQKLPEYVRTWSDYENPDRRSMSLQPMEEVYLYPEGKAGGSDKMVYIRIFFSIAFLILLIACVNYINLAMARSLERSREIGVRKTAGATRWQVAQQVMAETVLTCTVAFGLGFLLMELSLPYIQNLFDIRLTGVDWYNPEGLLILTGVLMGVSLMSGAYSAFYLSSFSPDEGLRGSRAGNRLSTASVRKGLVVGQFAISLIVITATVLIARQMNHIQQTRLDGNDERILVVNNTVYQLDQQYDAFRQTLLRSPAVEQVATGDMIGGFSMTMQLPDSAGMPARIQWVHGTHNYAETLGLELVSGRMLNPEIAGDSTRNVLINETAADYLGIEEAEGQFVPHPLNANVVGILRDYHASSFYEEIHPTVIRVDEARRTIFVRLKEGQISEGLRQVRETWDSFQTGYPLDYSFMDQELDNQYRSEFRMAKIFSGFAGFSIFIACLGLFGLAAYSARRRTKEIGIRKVLGATVSHIVQLLSREFLLLVALGFLLSIPVVWYGVNQWLQNFVYRIDVSPWLFAATGGAVLLIALVTVSWQSIRAALANPVDSLRSE